MEFIDDHPVVDYRIRFQRRTTITEEQAVTVKDGQGHIWLVRSHCQPPSYHPISRGSDERYRFNIQVVEQAVPLTGESLDAAAAWLDHPRHDQAYLNLGGARYPEPSDEASELKELVDYLHDLGAYHETDTPLTAVRRLIESRNGSTEVLQPPAEVDAGERQVVGHIYRNGTSKTRDLLEEVFGP